MKTILSMVAVVFFLSASAMAIILVPFSSWTDQEAKSPDILIARCTSTADPMVVINGMIWSSIDVLHVLKGNTKAGPARMVSQYWPKQGDMFLMFSTFESNQTYQGYNAAEEYLIVPINLGFPTNQLSGKPLKEQIKIILDARLEDLKKEMQHASEEKKRLEDGWKK